MSRIYEIADEYVERFAALHPVAATGIGVQGHDHEMTDYSPDGVAALAELSSRTLAALRDAPVDSERDRIARDVMVEELETGLEQFDLGEHLRDLSVLGSPMQSLRMCFDLMPRTEEEHWSNIAARMRLLPEALRKYRQSLSTGLDEGKTASQRQARECARQAAVWAGLEQGSRSFFHGLVEAFEGSHIRGSRLLQALRDAADDAASGYAAMRRYLLDDYLPRATPDDAVGRDRYAVAARAFNGIELDLEETYRWGWEQLRWVEREMAATAERIAPGEGIDAAIEVLETDPRRAIEGVEKFRQWMQDLQDRTISELSTTHFDIPGPVRRIEALIAPPGGALAMYYTPPSEDFSRPGRTWYPTGGRTRFPLWREVSIAYHEGVPGHHFQLATTKYLADDLSRFQRLLAGTSGHIEGWALYAERLMGELGYLENPDYYMGMLSAQALRSVRVIIDIGMHLELPIPDRTFHPGETWTPELGLEFITARGRFPADFVRSEVDRYLGMPGQAISYKVGERIWLASRAAARRARGRDFDLKAFHNRALRLGPMGLAQLQREMAE